VKEIVTKKRKNQMGIWGGAQSGEAVLRLIQISSISRLQVWDPFHPACDVYLGWLCEKMECGGT